MRIKRRSVRLSQRVAIVVDDDVVGCLGVPALLDEIFELNCSCLADFDGELFFIGADVEEAASESGGLVDGIEALLHNFAGVFSLFSSSVEGILKSFDYLLL